MQLDMLFEKEKKLLDEACGILGMFAEIKMKCLLLKKNKKISKEQVSKNIKRLQDELNTYRNDFQKVNKELEDVYHEFDKISGLDSSERIKCGHKK